MDLPPVSQDPGEQQSTGDIADPTNVLPADIQTILRRKSSRDPNSRFVKKLHILLQYVSKNPSKDDIVGLSWVTEDDFRMNKKALAQLMGIKVNTLNVNLRDLKFTQLTHDRNGWTRWRRENFTRDTVELDNKFEVGPFVGPAQAGALIPFARIALGNLTPADEAEFQKATQQLWMSLLESDLSKPVELKTFIERCATVFKRSEQPEDNAREVIQAIIAPLSPSHLTFIDFQRLLAMFGPPDTLMLKILSLLTYSNTSGQWLAFDHTAISNIGLVGYFDRTMPNCLIIRLMSGEIRRVFNIPTVKSTGQYISDENGHLYNGWEAYFKDNPVTPPITTPPVPTVTPSDPSYLSHAW